MLKSNQSCFQCGLKGHPIKDYPSLLRGEARSQAGMDAKQLFHDTREVRVRHTTSWHVHVPPSIISII